MPEKDTNGKEKPGKKKLIVVEGGDRKTSLYKSSAIYFSLVSSPEHGRRQVMSWVTCRDFVNDAIRSHVHGDKTCSNDYNPGTDRPIDMTKMRLLIHRGFDNKKKVNEEFRRKLFSGKAAVNLYERLAGWQESKITTVNHTDVGKQAWLMTGSGKWMKASNLLSMVTLIMRIVAKEGPLETDSLDALNKCWKRLSEDAEGTYGDKYYLKTCWKKFPLIMEHYDEIFSDPEEVLYPPPGDYFHGRGGIVSLCSFSTGIKELDKKFKEVCDKHLK